MNMDLLLNVVLTGLVLLLLPSGWRVWKGPTTADRLLAIDLITTLLAGIIVMLALISEQAMYTDVALALSALAFIGTIGIARFVAEGSVF